MALNISIPMNLPETDAFSLEYGEIFETTEYYGARIDEGLVTVGKDDPSIITWDEYEQEAREKFGLVLWRADVAAIARTIYSTNKRLRVG